MTTSRTPLRRRALLGLAALSLLAVACGDDDDTATSDGSAGAGDGGGSAATDDLVVSAFTTGGYVPVETAAVEFPELTILADGTAITRGPQIEIFPPPALPALQAVTLDPEEVDRIRDDIVASGLLGEGLDFGVPAVADAPSLILTLASDAGEVELTVPSAGFDDDASLTDEQRADRLAVGELLDGIEALVAGHEAEAEVYGPPGYLLRIRAYDPTFAGDLEQAPVAWPLDDSLLADDADQLFGCVEVTGDDLVAFAAAAASANQLTPWETGSGDRHQVLVRPWLPHEPGCAQFG